MSGQNIGQAVAERNNKLAVIDQYKADFAAVLPSHMHADHWVRLTQGALRRNVQLQGLLKTNPGSVLAALLDCARLGLELGDTYHLLPMGGEVVGVADYRGLVELMWRAGAVSSVRCEVVRERDLDYYDWVCPKTGTTRRRQRFEWVPDQMDVPHHAPLWHIDRGSLILVYAYAVMWDGAISQVVVLNRKEVMEVKAVSKTAKHPDSMWNKWEDRAWRKTALRILAKFVPTSAEDRRQNRDAPTEAAVSVPDTVPAALLDDDVVDGEIVHDNDIAAAPAAAQTDSVRITR